MSRGNFTFIWFKLRLFPCFAKIQDGVADNAVNRLELAMVNLCENLQKEQAFHRENSHRENRTDYLFKQTLTRTNFPKYVPFTSYWNFRHFLVSMKRPALPFQTFLCPRKFSAETTRNVVCHLNAFKPEFAETFREQPWFVYYESKWFGLEFIKSETFRHHFL